MKADPTYWWKTNRRNHRGSSIAEFAPALLILVILIFFPTLDILCLCFDYGVVALLNYNQSREASLLPYEKANDPSGPVKKEIPDTWRRTGLATFVKVVGDPDTTISYRNGQSNGDSTTEKIVIVTTNVVCDPFVHVPIPGVKVPGLNAPMKFSATSERPMENPDNALE
jgi:hypothetical protein